VISARPNARVLSADAATTARERAEAYLDGDDVARALGCVDAAFVVVGCDANLGERTADVLREAGAFARARYGRVVYAGSLALLERVRVWDAVADDVRTLVSECARAVVADRAPPNRLRLRDRVLDFTARARVMGILNVTPDSFHDRGRYSSVDRARARAAEMVTLGADVIDVGGQSYAHWNPRIAAEEERRRVLPVIRALVADGIGVPISIDTYKALVAEAALDAGAHLVNDCSGLGDDALAGVVARYDAGLVVMHIRGELNVRSPAHRYDDALAEIVDFLRDRTDCARAAGVAPDGIAIDPGLEFGKEPATDLEILARFGDLRSLGYPVIFAGSRKSFIGRIFERPSGDLLAPSLAAAALAIVSGAALVRAHDVAETVQLATMLAAVRVDRRDALVLAARMQGTPEQGGGTFARSRPV